MKFYISAGASYATGDVFLLEMIMQKYEPKIMIKIRLTPAYVADLGRVRIGGESPSFGPVRAAPANTIDPGRVRIGGESPSFGPVRAAPANTIDPGRVRIGGESPSFGPVRH